MLEEAKRLREQASELIKQAEEIEKECFKDESENFVGKFFYNNCDTYYKVFNFDKASNAFKCFSLYLEADNTLITEYEYESIEQLKRRKEITKEEAENVFNKAFEFSRKQFIG